MEKKTKLQEVMSELGKSSWEKRVEKYGLKRAKEMMKEARSQVGKNAPQTAS